MKLVLVHSLVCLYSMYTFLSLFNVVCVALLCDSPSFCYAHSIAINFIYLPSVPPFPNPHTSLSIYSCEVGDLSGRLGHLHGSGMHTLFFTMVDFDEIIGLSVVVHNEAQTRIACGTIKEIEGMSFCMVTSAVCVCVFELLVSPLRC